ncbi:MAG: M48 family metallopeptidase [Gammaproteobacteria bacterium]|nr:M48 family metallopeptidase [Gammaproteobacteria bacterium]
MRRPSTSADKQEAARHFAAIIEEQFAPFAARGHPLPRLTLRWMRTRWGSLSTRRRGYLRRWFGGGPPEPARMTLNLALLEAPRQCVEYVVVHELCHLEHQGHGPAFYRLMETLMPDWRGRKRRLEASIGALLPVR